MATRKIYEIIVGNIGTVYTGKSRREAMKHFYEYKNQSMTNYGRAAGEPVTLMENGEITQEHDGAQENPASRAPSRATATALRRAAYGKNPRHAIKRIPRIPLNSPLKIFVQVKDGKEWKTQGIFPASIKGVRGAKMFGTWLARTSGRKVQAVKK
jgi:hypothetical protein